MGLFDLKCVNCGAKLTKGHFQNRCAYILSSETDKIYISVEEYQKNEKMSEPFKVLCKDCGDYEIQKQNELNKKLKEMIITTTSSIEGKSISGYRGVVTAQVFMGVNLFKDIFSGIRDLVGGRSKAIEGEFNKAKNILLKELTQECLKLKANAIIGLKIDFEDVGKISGNAFMLLGTGTAVVID